MIIGVNARLLTKPYIGIGQYTRYLMRELAKIDNLNDYLLVVPEKINDEIAGEFSKNVHIKVLPESNMGTTGMKKTFWEQIMVPEYFRSKNIDIAYFTYPCNPWGNNWYKGGGKTILTVHDCIPWKYKEYRNNLFSKMYHNRTKIAVKKADKIVTVSNSSKRDIIEYCGVKADKIEVIYNDAGDIYKTEIKKDFMNEVLDKFGITSHNYFLYCGGYDIRKNVRILLDNYHFYSEKADNPIPLVLVGNKLFNDKLYKDFNTKFSSDKGKIITTGFIEDQELKALYSGCRAFVHLSTDEGFNIPLVEAANCKAPLIISDIPVHREIVGDAALYIDLNKKHSCSEEFLNFDLSKYEYYTNLSADICKKFSWQKSAHKVKDMLSLYQ